MFNLIETTLNESTIKTVNARELWVFLGSKQDFSTWIKKRIADYGFVEGVDFVQNTFPQKNGTLESITYGRSKIEYYISLDMAKELSMVERNEKGQQARRYFIECERKLKEAKPALPRTYLEALKALVIAEEEKERLILENKQAQQHIIELQPKAALADFVCTANGMLIGNFAKTVGLGQNKLFAWLRDKGILIGCKGLRRNVPMQRYIECGYFEVKETPVKTSNGVQIAFTPMLTGRGQEWLIKKLQDNGLI